MAYCNLADDGLLFIRVGDFGFQSQPSRVVKTPRIKRIIPVAALSFFSSHVKRSLLYPVKVRWIKASMILMVPKATNNDSIKRMLQPKPLAAKKTGIMASQGEKVSIKKREVAVALSDGLPLKEWLWRSTWVIPRKT